MIMSFVLGVLLAVLGMVAAYTASQWSDFNHNQLVQTLKTWGISFQAVVKAHDLLASLAVS